MDLTLKILSILSILIFFFWSNLLMLQISESIKKSPKPITFTSICFSFGVRYIRFSNMCTLMFTTSPAMNQTFYFQSLAMDYMFYSQSLPYITLTLLIYEENWNFVLTGIPKRMHPTSPVKVCQGSNTTNIGIFNKQTCSCMNNKS